MKRIIIEESSLIDWNYSAVFVYADSQRKYIYFNDLREIAKEIESLKQDEYLEGIIKKVDKPQ